MRILISRSETDLLSIRAEFRKKFGKSLYSSLQVSLAASAPGAPELHPSSRRCTACPQRSISRPGGVMSLWLLQCRMPGTRQVLGWLEGGAEGLACDGRASFQHSALLCTGCGDRGLPVSLADPVQG